MREQSRYDGVAEWYERTFAGYARGDASSAGHLHRLLGPGNGWCLDIACGTGLHFDAIAATGRRVVGLDISSDQLRVAKRRATTLVLADAIQWRLVTSRSTRYPRRISIPTSATSPRSSRRSSGSFAPGGRFVYIGTHPCFVGHFVELQDERTKIIHAGYRDAGWQDDSPYFGEHGCGRRVGYRHVPLAELVGALIASGLGLTGIEEPQEDHPPSSDIPGMLALVATKDTLTA